MEADDLDFHSGITVEDFEAQRRLELIAFFFFHFRIVFYFGFNTPLALHCILFFFCFCCLNPIHCSRTPIKGLNAYLNTAYLFFTRYIRNIT